MIRRTLPLALLALLSCQDYRFTPVGRCIVQPGQKRIQLESAAAADILFVVDDSGSMEQQQANLANNFGSFIGTLAQTQQDRINRGLEALDFHIAVTSSSVFQVRSTGNNCSGSVCHLTSPTFPTDPNDYACSGTAVCGDLVDRFFSVGNCSVTTTQACAVTADCPSGESCQASSCQALGVAGTRGSPFPSGDFVSLGANPKVLHFTKALDWANYSTDPTIQGLIARFEENAQTGSCGSNEEQHLEAGRLAVQKALAGSQTAPAGEWLHPGAKLVVVWVGNEDDCSQPKNASNAIILSGSPGADSCAQEQAKPIAQQRLVPIADYAAFFGSLGRPFAAAFIYGGAQGPTGFVPGNCSCPSPLTCAGFGPGNRFHGLADAIRLQGSSVIEGSICDASFASTLQDIAGIVPPLESLRLPTQPASGVVTQLRIVDSGNNTLKVCAGPDAAGEWWFVADCNDAARTPTGGTPPGSDPAICIGIKAGACQASPGQSYVAEYLGRVPAGGCPVGAGGAGACATALGGVAADWTCDGPAGGTGTCLCAGP